MAEQRQQAVRGIWADNANTTIPTPPVVGIAYRDTALTPGEVAAGQAYKALGDSAVWNQNLWDMSGSILNNERYGIPVYSPFTQYQQGGLAMWTDDKLYRVRRDISGVPPVGTPPTNGAYWEDYIPDGVLEKLPDVIDTVAGLTLYVDYSKSASGDGLTAGTAFKSFSDCFTAIREKYSGPNGIFQGDVTPGLFKPEIVPTFRIIATTASPSSVYTVEDNGAWHIQNMNITFELNARFACNFHIISSGSTVIFTGSGVLRVRGRLQFTTCTVYHDIDIYVETSGSNHGVVNLRTTDLNIGSGATLSALGAGEDTSATFGASSSAINIGGTLTVVMSVVQMVLTDFYNGGTMTLGVSNGTHSMTFESCTIRCATGCVCNMIYPEFIGGTYQFTGTLRLGGTTFSPQFGIISRGSFVRLSEGMTVEQYGSYAPVKKGAITVGGSVEGIILQSEWPGTEPWTIYGNGYYDPPTA